MYPLLPGVAVAVARLLSIKHALATDGVHGLAPLSAVKSANPACGYEETYVISAEAIVRNAFAAADSFADIRAFQ
jgi:hypothetical protein